MPGHRLTLIAALAGTLSCTVAGFATSAPPTPPPGDDFGVVLERAASPEKVAAAEAAAARDQLAGARPVLRVPFTCGEVWSAKSRSDHDPSRWSIDFNRTPDLGRPVITSAAGTVLRAEEAAGYGKWIEIGHGNGWRTRYAHLMSRSVSVGDQVGPARQIGRVGDTGQVTGPHLHYEQRKDGVVVQPLFGNRTWFNYPGPQDMARGSDC